MKNELQRKVKSEHLDRSAYLYIRQSTVHQVFENPESAKRQYDLRRRAIALGWPDESVIVVDSDLGQSGASAEDREGFKRLVSEVGTGQAGIVMGLEVSRLARSSADWHRLLEICALTDTLILDEDGIYDPTNFNDRLLLGLKGTMSEAELHVLKARLHGGLWSKARRGELKLGLPVGLAYDAADRVVLDPDKQVQESMRLFFETFCRTGSALATTKYFLKNEIKFPRKLRTGPNKGTVVWGELDHAKAIQLLHNPRYAGAFAFGRSKTRRKPDGGTIVKKLPREQWDTLILDAHPGYISWSEYEENQRRLLENAGAHGLDRRKNPPREGPALLQGLAVCGICGSRMVVHYYDRKGRTVPQYVCWKNWIATSNHKCQTVSGLYLDDAVGSLLVEAVAPLALDVSLTVQEELRQRIEDADRMRRKHVERTRYEAELAKRRYMRVDPDNRLVADSLEADWNNKLREWNDAQREYERLRDADRMLIDEEQKAAMLALATDFPRLWNDPNTSPREKKRMARLMIEDVTLIKNKNITAHVRFKGGATRTITVPTPLPAGQLVKTSADVVAEVDRLTNQHTDSQVAAILNERGFKSGTGKAFNTHTVRNIRRAYGVKSLYEKLREKGMLTKREMAARLGITPVRVKIWARHGLVKGHVCNDMGERLYEDPGSNPPVKRNGQRLSKRRRFPEECGISSK